MNRKIGLFYIFTTIYCLSVYGMQPGVPALVAAQQIAAPQQPLQSRLAQPRVPYCAACLAAWGTNKRQGCNHSFCNGCFTAGVNAECPTCTEEANQCAICLELFDNSVQPLICGHKFCANCIANWQASQASNEDVPIPTCPSCRQPLVFKQSLNCEICRVPFKSNDEITPPLVCKLIGWAFWREKYICVQQFAHRFHDKCFHQHYMKRGQHRSDLREHTCVCPVHPIYETCQQHPGGCGWDAHPVGHIKLPCIIPERGGPVQYVEYGPGSGPNSTVPSPRTVENLEGLVGVTELTETLLGGKPPSCTIQ